MEPEYEIPAEIYDRVLELMAAIVNASAADDSVLGDILGEQLLAFCQEQTEAGHGSGFLWEAMGDVTAEPDRRMALYQRALSYALRNGEPVQTLHCELGDLHAEAGRTDDALLHYESARESAIARDDLQTEGRAAASLVSLENSQIPDAG